GHELREQKEGRERKAETKLGADEQRESRRKQATWRGIGLGVWTYRGCARWGAHARFLESALRRRLRSGSQNKRALSAGGGEGSCFKAFWPRYTCPLLRATARIQHG